jgi:hypothetical protein
LHKVWAVFRFDDHLGTNPSHWVTRGAAGKVGSTGPRSVERAGALCGCNPSWHEATISGTEWLTAWHAILKAEPFAFSRDYCLPMPPADWQGCRREPVEYAEGLGFGSLVCDDYGDRATRTGDGLWRTHCYCMRARRCTGLNTQSARTWTAGRLSAQSIRRVETTGTLDGGAERHQRHERDGHCLWRPGARGGGEAGRSWSLRRDRGATDGCGMFGREPSGRRSGSLLARCPRHGSDRAVWYCQGGDSGCGTGT